MKTIRTFARAVLPALVLAACAGALLAVGCGRALQTATPPEKGAAAPATFAGKSVPVGALTVTHGGVGSPPDWSPDCQAAADSALAALRTGGTALDAAVAGTMVMENIHRFNAGTGANIRVDGKTIQMDAAVMTSEGRFGAVAVIERVLHPVLVAKAVLGTPHLLLAGEGATRFAHAAGFRDVVPTCPEAEAKFRKRAAALLTGKSGDPFDTFDWRRYWNFPNPIPPELGGPSGAVATGGGSGAGAGKRLPLWLGDTVGTVCRDGGGKFAATLSTGGTSITLYGRVGDVPVFGAGLYAGPAGAVACTGLGEMIIRQSEARTVYELLDQGVPAREAVRRGCMSFPAEADLGVIAVGRDGWGVAANRTMAFGQAWAGQPPAPAPTAASGGAASRAASSAP